MINRGLNRTGFVPAAKYMLNKAKPKARISMVLALRSFQAE
jgi:hypothetical protein